MNFPDSWRVMIVGASGQFGQRLCQRLVWEDRLALIIAGRDYGKLEVLKAHLVALRPSAEIETVSCDISLAEFADQLFTYKPNLVVHLAGPFQGQDYKVAKACLIARIPYIDMADGREFVSGFSVLDCAAKEKDVFLITGASTVPALSSAVIDNVANDFIELQEVDYGICAGLKSGLGSATLQAVLSYCGKPYKTRAQSKDVISYGLDESRFYKFPTPVGPRYIVNCDVPDHALLPARYPMLKTLRFGSCIDVPGLAFILSLMSRAVQLGLVKSWDFLSDMIVPFMNAVKFLGNSHSGFFMLCGGMTGAKYTRKSFEIIARNGSGLEIPVTPVVVLIKRILAGEKFPAGAYPCVGLVSLEEFRRALAAFPIAFTWREIE